MNDVTTDSRNMEPHEAGGWRRAVKWTAIGSGVYTVVAFGLAMLSYIGAEPDDRPSNYAVNLTGRRVDLYQLDDGEFPRGP